MATKSQTSSKSRTKKPGKKPMSARNVTKTASTVGKGLVIVESPAKARTVGQILGRKYVVVASQGHMRDLPKSKIGVDVEQDFQPSYVVMQDKRSLLNALQKAGDEAAAIYLATDPDREGEAISWHLQDATQWAQRPDPPKRVVFHEITKQAIQEAFEHPREIDMQLVNAQQARRILDRLVGYQISPLLWRRVQRGLSAGRVQSVSLRIVVDREKAIQAFVPVESWTLEAQLRKQAKEAMKVLPVEQEAFDAGRRPGPRIFHTGYLLEGPRQYWEVSSSVSTPAEIDREIERAKRLVESGQEREFNTGHIIIESPLRILGLRIFTKLLIIFQNIGIPEKT